MKKNIFFLLLLHGFWDCSSLQQINFLSKYKIAKIESLQVDSNKAIISGFVREIKTNEPLYGCNIVIQGTNKGVVVDSFGFFKMALKPGDYCFTISFVGFNQVITKKIKLLPNTKTEIEVTLQPAPPIMCG